MSDNVKGEHYEKVSVSTNAFTSYPLRTDIYLWS